MNTPSFSYSFNLLNQDDFLRMVSLEWANLIDDISETIYELNTLPRELLLNQGEWERLEPEVRFHSVNSVISKLKEEYGGIEKQLEDENLTAPNTCKSRLKSVYNNVSEVKKGIESAHYLNDTIKSLFIIELDKFKSRLQMKFDRATKFQEVDTTSFIRIKWTGKPSTLATLFSDLRLQLNKEGKPLIDANRTDLAKFLAAAFVDKDNEGFSYQTLYTYLDPKEDRKKAANRINVADSIENSGEHD